MNPTHKSQPRILRRMLALGATLLAWTLVQPAGTTAHRPVAPTAYLGARADAAAPCPPSALLCEDFEDTSFASRGWYDSNGGAISAAEHAPGSSHSLECRYAQGARVCAAGGPARHLFEPTESLYFEYWVKYGPGFVGSGRPYHPHEFQFLTNKDDKYIGPAGTHLTTYVEQLAGLPRLALQDLLNVDTGCILRNDNSFIGCNGDHASYKFTENRSVASCNLLLGDLDKRDCFQSDATHWYSARTWDAPAGTTLYDGEWHRVATLFQLNSIAGGKGVVDGKMRYWLDGRLLISYDHILYRTAANADLLFNQLLIAPYIGDGSPVNQTMWVDDLRVLRTGDGGPAETGNFKVFLPFTSTTRGPNQLMSIGRYQNELGAARALAVDGTGNTAFIGQDRYALAIDISDPKLPREVARLGPFEAPVEQLHVAGDRMYAAAGTAGLEIIDIRDPRTPRILGRFTDSIHRVGAAGDVVIATAGPACCDRAGSRVLSIDVRDPAHAALLDSIPSQDRCWFSDVAISGPTAFVSADICELFTLDVTNPRDLKIAYGEYADRGDTAAVRTAGTRAYLVFGDGPSIHVLNVTNPNDPQHLGTLGSTVFPNGGQWYFERVRDLWVNGNQLLVLGQFNESGSHPPYFWGLWVFDVSDPTAPTLSAMTEIADPASVVVARESILVTSASGLRIYAAGP